MNKMYQRLKRKCISLVLFALLVAFIVPYYAYAADNGAEPAAAASAAESTGDFSMSESETSESETSKREETESSEEEEQQTREDADASTSTEADVQESTQEQTLTKKERKIVRKNLQLGRSYGFYAWGAEEDAAQGQSDESGVAVQTEAEAEVLSPDIDTVLSKVRSYILSKDTKPDYSSIWNVIGLKRSGLYVPESYINLFYSNVIAYCESKDWQITRAKYSDYSKLILAVTAIGVDARDVMGHNLLAYLSDYENVSRQGNNGTIWALIALKSNPVYTIPEDSSAKQQNSEELMVQKIVEMQCADGGWTLMGDTGDSDMTGMAMQALASYYNKDGYEYVTAAIDKGLAWIEKNQLSSGGFGTMKTETSESVAQIITALCGVGIDCGEDARFIKNGKWPMTGLFQYYMPEGGFMHVAAGAGNNGGGAGGIIDGMATEQGLYATVAYRRFLDGETFLYDMSDVAISAGTKPVVSPTIDTGSNSGGNSSSTTARKTETKPAASKVKVIKVGLNYSTIYLTKGKSKTLKATVSPSNATNKSVKWSSSNKKIAAVNAKGKVTGKKAGTVTITVKATDGSGKKAVCKVIVTAPETTDKKTTIASTAATSQTRQITTPAASSTGSSRTSVPATSGTTKKLSSGSGETTTTKKKNTAAEATTGGWSFSGDNYVPETNSAESETDTVQEDTGVSDEGDRSKADGIRSVALPVAGGAAGLVAVEALGFVLYKKHRGIAGLLKKVMNVPDNYKIVFIQGGATQQFSMVPLNLLKNGKADYAITGAFSKKAAAEAKKYGDIHIVYDGSSNDFKHIPTQDELDLSKDASYLHICANNTIYGTEWKYVPETNGVPIIADMSSNILSKPVDVSKYGMIYAGAQKNMGIAGLGVAIIREDLLQDVAETTPVLLDYKLMIKNDSMYNTPPAYAIYVLGLVLEWIDSLGGLEVMKERNEKKAKLVYDYLDQSTFYKAHSDKENRSLMNVTFTTPNKDLDAKFVKESIEAGMTNLKGHRSVGGIRASIYNAMPYEGVEKLVAFMKEFEQNNQ